MASKVPSAEDIKEAYIKARVDAWLSRAVPMTMSEAFTRQSRLETQREGWTPGPYLELLPFPVAVPDPALRAAMPAPAPGEEGKEEDGMVISDDSNPKGYLFVPLDSVPSDRQFRRQQPALAGEVPPARLLAAEALLDAEIERGGYLVFDDSERPLADMKTYEKVSRVLCFHCPLRTNSPPFECARLT